MATPDEFAKAIKMYADGIQTTVPQLVRKTALAIDQAVVLATPVDTGRARSNWLVSVDAPATEEIDAYSPGKEGSTAGPNAQAAIDQGQEAVATYGPDNKSIHITNNVPYIGRLNEGHSAQAPANFVEQAIDAGIAAVQGSKILKKGK